jgi:hypothetical protein
MARGKIRNENVNRGGEAIFKCQRMRLIMEHGC